MTKLIIVGHKSIDLKSIEKIFNHYGMISAEPSRREKLSPTEIEDLIQKVTNNIPKKNLNHTIDHTKEIAPTLPREQKTSKRQKRLNRKQAITISQSNQQEIEEIKTIPSLWDNLALDLFLGNIEHELWGWSTHNLSTLDYWIKNDPDVKIIFIYNNPVKILNNFPIIELKNNEIGDLIESWEKYNINIINRYKKYKNRSILINDSQIINNLQKTIDKLNIEININNKEKINQNSYISNNDATHLLSEVLLTFYPQMDILYNKLNSNSIFNDYFNTTHKNKIERTINAIRDVLNKDKIILESNKKINDLEISLKNKSNNYEILTNEKKNIEEEIKKLKNENEQLLKNLKTVQLILEEKFIEKNISFKPQKQLRGAGELFKKTITYQLGADIIKNAKNFPIGWFKIPFSQQKIMKDYEEQIIKGTLPNFHELKNYEDAYEIERIKKHLSYKLGEVCLRYKRNIFKWIIIPFKMIEVKKEFNKDKTSG